MLNSIVTLFHDNVYFYNVRPAAAGQAPHETLKGFAMDKVTLSSYNRLLKLSENSCCKVLLVPYRTMVGHTTEFLWKRGVA